MPLTPIPFHHVKIDSPFWSPKMALANVTARTCMAQCEKTGRFANFRRAARREAGGYEGAWFNDSDVYKVIEGVAYTLMNAPDPELEAWADQVIDDICAAQQRDGYLHSYFTLTGLEKRFTDMDAHEMYCFGHMVEGAVAYAQATGKTALLDAAEGVMCCVMNLFGPGKRDWVPGHEEIELALVRLYRHTGKREYIEFAHWLLEERGHGLMRTPQPIHAGGAYCQNDLPVKQQRQVKGHSVRAMYLYTGMADMDAVTGRDEYGEALSALWNDTVPGNMYITGGIGQERHHEGFTRAWHKPNLTAYNETCAAIGMAMWNHRMALKHGESRFSDVVETEMYNGALSGLSLDGQRFFYENPLASLGDHHRQEWFGCSCCPTNLARFVPSVGGYAYAMEDHTLHVMQYIGGTLQTGGVRLRVVTDYPWDGKVVFHVDDCAAFDTLRLRIPAWCRRADADVPCTRTPGALLVPVQAGDTVTLTMDMPIERVHEDERVAECAGRVCIRRGPVVYCAEAVDNPGIVAEYFHADLSLPASAPLALGDRMPELGDAPCIVGGGVKLIPYAMWDNRDPGAMCVWLRETE